MLKRSGQEQPITPAVNLELEQALLGAVLVNNTAYHTVSEIVEEEHFSEVLHRTIWRLIGKRLEAGGTITATLLAADLGSDASAKITEEVDVKKYVARLVSEAVGVVTAPDYAAEIADLWRTRRLRELGEDLVLWADAGADRESVDDMLSEVDSEVTAIQFGRAGNDIKSLRDAVAEAVSETETAYRRNEPPGLSFGLPTLDRLCGRMMPGDLIVLLAPSHHGKTALLTQILCSVSSPSANPVVPSYMAELEMQAMDIARRLLARHGGVPVEVQESGRGMEQHYDQLMEAAQNLARFPVLIDSGASGKFSKVSSLTARIRALHKLRGIGIVGIDHVKLITTSNPRWDMIEIISNAARKFKQLAMELGIPVVLLAQPTRESRKRDTASLRPRVEDIYGGGILEECADIILGLHNPVEGLLQREPERGTKEYGDWLAQKTKWTGFVEVSALKRRRGKQSDWVRLAYDGEITTFSEV